MVLCLLFLVMSCALNDDEDDIAGLELEESFKVYLNEADNAVIGLLSQNASFSVEKNILSVSESDLFTLNASGDASVVAIEAQRVKTVRKTSKIKRSGRGNVRVKGAVYLSDAWYLVDKWNQAHKARYKPKKSFKARNASLFYEDDIILYLGEDENLYSVDISSDVSDDQYEILRSGVVQAVQGLQGDWILEMKDGRILHWEPAADIDTRLKNQEPGNQYDAEVDRFFVPHQEGFLFQGNGGGLDRFFRVVWRDSTLDITIAGDVYMYTWGDKCDYLPVGTEELLFCGDRWLYQLGDTSGDMEEIDFIWAGHASAISEEHVFTVASDNYVYHYTQVSESISRFSRINLEDDTCAHIFYEGSSTACAEAPLTQLYQIDKLSVSSDDIIRFCGTRLGETQLKIVQIFDITSDTPRTTETDIASCEQIEALE